MQVTIEHDESTSTIELDEGSTIRDALDALDIAPSTVLAVHDGTIVPHDSKINADISLELITVSSGG
jgi:sulfur carrier protein ThiS